MAKAKNCCPCCGRKIVWLQKWRFSNIIGLRKSAPCPYCGERLTWKKLPWMLMTTGSYLLILFLPLIVLRIEISGILRGVVWVAIFLALTGTYMLKLEMSESNVKDKLQKK